MKAMILAAGLGTRLRPYTEHCPKPLFPILGKPLIFHQLEQLRKYGLGPFVVNTHHLREQFKTLLGSEKDVSLQIEDSVLGTGGGLRKAAIELGSEPVLVINGDIIHTFDLSMLVERHKRSGCPISMVFHDLPRFNNVQVSGDQRVISFRESSKNHSGHDLLAFTGIHIFDPGILLEAPEETNFDIIDFYNSLIGSGSVEIGALKMEDGFWTDIGTPADYLKLHGDILTRNAPVHLQKIFPATHDNCCVMSDVDIGENVQFEDWVFVGEGARVGNDVKITRSVIWDGAVVGDGAIIKDGIIVA